MTLFLISFLFKNLFIYLFWVRWVLLVAHGLFVAAHGLLSSCGMGSRARGLCS